MGSEGTGLAAWRLISVAGIIGALAVVLLWQVGREPVPLPMSTPVATVESIPRPSESALTTAPPSTAPPQTQPLAAPTNGPDAVTEAEVLAAAKGALDAWGRFAVSGDLEALGPWFDPEGPQYGQLAQESPELQAEPLGNPPYLVTLESPVVSLDEQGRPVVEGSVVFARTGEAAQRLEWRMAFRRGSEGWALWSVQPQ